MLWIPLALMTALASASQDSWVKHKFSRCSAYEILAFPMLYSLPLIAIAALWLTIPPLDTVYFWCFLISLPLNAVAFLLHMRAIQISPLSLTLPYLSFSPAFIFGTGYLLLGELPNRAGSLGVCIIICGSYVLNIDPATYTPLAPLRAVFREKGSMLMLVVAILYSFGAVIGKKAILHSSVMFFTLNFFLALNIITLFLIVMTGKGSVATLLSRPVPGAVAGVLLFLHLICHGWAISMTKAVYMISIKRMSIIFGVMFGGLFFSEKNMAYRLIGAGLMIVGATLVTLMG